MLLNSFPTKNTIFSHFFMAIFLPMAFPPTVREDTIAVSNIAMIGLFNKLTTNDAVRDPDTMPQISPITSLHILLVLFEFLISLIHSFEPFIFLEALAWNVDSSQLKTATPIISNIIPININIIIPNIINKTFIFAVRLDRLANMNDKIKVTINIIGIQLSFFILFPLLYN